LKINVYDEDSKPLPQVQIINESDKSILLTNSLGYVITKIRLSPTIHLHFSKQGYRNLDTTINANYSLDTINISVNLFPKDFTSKEVVVTATRTEKELQNVPIPISTIHIDDVKPIAIYNLGEILSELTSLPLIEDYRSGSGVQLQGLNPDFTLLLINGEPIGYRTGEVFDISQFSIGNASRIEIVRGPNSSIYGSNALAGVINIITEETDKSTDLSITGKYGSNSTYNLYSNLKNAFVPGILSSSLYYNFSQTDGYKLIPNSVGKTVPEILDHTFHEEIFWNVSEKSRFKLSLRGNFSTEKNNYLTNASSQTDTIFSLNKVNDINASIVFRNILNQSINYEFRSYYSYFSTNTNDRYSKNNALFDQYFFSQNLFKIEFQSNYLVSTTNYLTFGIGYQTEGAKSSRIVEGIQRNHQFYFYVQDDFYPLDKLNLITSFRFDRHSEYPSQVSPRIAVAYKVIPELTLKGSIGTGFKAPTFEELYLDWTNPMAGYSVFGITYAAKGIAKFQEQGQIAELLISPDSIPTLKPEKSISFDLGSNLRLADFLFFKINLFRNNVLNLIDFLPIAIKTNGQRLHTYQNVNRIFTQGIESSLEFSFLKYFKINFSYQYLETGDLDVIKKIESNKIFKRDENGFDRAVELSEYGGLFHRPRHSGIIRVTYHNNDIGLYSSIRFSIKSKYGYKDINGNAILDDLREYAPGYGIVNLNISKSIAGLFSVNLAINNVFDKKDIRLLTSNPGRTFTISVSFNYVQQ
jgi:outer membrane receptor for ferrienterochelin and colicins